MKCPVDADVELVMAERQGVEIDYCPTCRGIWLDRGELDKILDRATPAAAPAVPVPPSRVTAADAQPRYADPRLDPRRDPRSDRRYDEPRRDSHHDDHHDDHRDDHRTDHRDDRRDGHDGRDPRVGDKKKRKGSWLGDIFDF
jgi:Zn-finger nucleic acid-binding protein